MELVEFYQQLVTKVGSDEKLRPFVCRGNPLECEIIVIGINPATQMKEEFWHYFNKHEGFEFSKWEGDYINERKSIGKRSIFSPTRCRLNYLSNKLPEYKILETNVFCFPTEKAAYLTNQDKTTLVLDFLLKSVEPRIILVHGKEAREHLSQIVGQNIERYKDRELLTLRYNQSFEVSIIAINHLFNQSYQLLDEITMVIQEEMKKNSL